jgi:hypothetical protein
MTKQSVRTRRRFEFRYFPIQLSTEDARYFSLLGFAIILNTLAFLTTEILIQSGGFMEANPLEVSAIANPYLIMANFLVLGLGFMGIRLLLRQPWARLIVAGSIVGILAGDLLGDFGILIFKTTYFRMLLFGLPAAMIPGAIAVWEIERVLKST